MIQLTRGLEMLQKNIEALPLYIEVGTVVNVVGLVIEGRLPQAEVGCFCQIYNDDEKCLLDAEVVGFRGKQVLLMSLGELRGIKRGDKIYIRKRQASIAVGNHLLGRIIGGHGEFLDDGPAINLIEEKEIYSSVCNPLKKEMIRTPIDVGIKSINGLLTCGRGQREGIFAAAGVGKSILLGMIAKNTTADVNVIALVGERGREVKEFIENSLGEEGLKKTVLVVVTSDQSPLLRVRGAFVAVTIAEYFRSQGANVLFMMDSMTRLAMAQREIGLSIGEPPATKGYTPSVYSLMPKLLERIGNSNDGGTMTGLITVLVEGDDIEDPIADALMSILDGHIVLSRKLAALGQYPAIDVLQSTSRLMTNIISEEHKTLAKRIKETLSIYHEAEDLINIGAYSKGSNAKIDYAIERMEKINQFLNQNINMAVTLEDTIEAMREVLR